MKKRYNYPAPLRRRLLLMSLFVIGSLLVGASVAIFLQDTTMASLSAVLCCLGVWQVYTLDRMCRTQCYEVVEGVCTAIIPKSVGKYRKVLITTVNGTETTLLLQKRSCIAIGEHYRFYFQATQPLSIGNEYRDGILATDHFLGYEMIE